MGSSKAPHHACQHPCLSPSLSHLFLSIIVKTMHLSLQRSCHCQCLSVALISYISESIVVYLSKLWPHRMRTWARAHDHAASESLYTMLPLGFNDPCWKAWRRLLDRGSNNKCSWPDFEAACKKLGHLTCAVSFSRWSRDAFTEECLVWRWPCNFLWGACPRRRTLLAWWGAHLESFASFYFKVNEELEGGSWPTFPWLFWVKYVW